MTPAPRDTAAPGCHSRVPAGRSSGSQQPREVGHRATPSGTKGLVGEELSSRGCRATVLCQQRPPRKGAQMGSFMMISVLA